jgi:ATP dependent DNA ligase domain
MPALPQWVRPQLTQLVDAAPDGDQWLHELKYDGYRLHARLNRGAVKLLTRTGLDWTHKYPAIAEAVAAFDARQAYLDGELCGVGPDGITSFNIVQHRSTRLGQRQRGRAGLLPVRSSLSRRRGSPDPAADRAQGAAQDLTGVTTRKCSECTTSWTKHERAARWYVRSTLGGCRSGGGRSHVSDVPRA